MEELTPLEEAIKQQGENLIKHSKADFDLVRDPISIEIQRFRVKYGPKKWFKKYTRHAERLARKEQDKLKRSQ
jgi:hypothetical protein